jgi:hypothetical protein
MQYHLKNENKGMIMAFRRPDSQKAEFDLRGLREIIPDSNYRLTIYPGYELLTSRTMTGKELLQSKAEITELPGSVLIEYEKMN